MIRSAPRSVCISLALLMIVVAGLTACSSPGSEAPAGPQPGSTAAGTSPSDADALAFAKKWASEKGLQVRSARMLGSGDGSFDWVVAADLTYKTVAEAVASNDGARAVVLECDAEDGKSTDAVLLVADDPGTGVTDLADYSSEPYLLLGAPGALASASSRVALQGEIYPLPAETVGWADTGLKLMPGDVIGVAASGAVELGDGVELGSGGSTKVKASGAGYPLPDGPLGALVVDIGGSRFVPTTGLYKVSAEGSLMIGINDNWSDASGMQDNTGSHELAVHVLNGK